MCDNVLLPAFFRPLLVIGGSSDVDQESMGAFQEYPQVGRNSYIKTFVVLQMQ